MSTGSAMAKLRVMASRSAGFQAFVGAVDPAGALLKIYTDVADEVALARTDGQLDTGYALITAVDEPERSDSVAGGGATVFDRGGALNLELVGPRAGADDAVELAAFRTSIDTIVDEVLAESGTDGALVLQGISKTQGPYAEAEDAVEELGTYHFVDYSVEWGFV